MNDDQISNEDMIEAFKELPNTVYWRAIKRYIRSKELDMLWILRTTDPDKDSTSIARVQGMLSGIFLLENYISSLKKKEFESVDENTDEVKEEPYVPGGKVTW